jgi:hypothetical protein
MKLLTLEEAITKVPAIATESPSPRVSGRYRFFSTKNVLEQALSNNWSIMEAKGVTTRKVPTRFGAHSVRLIHNSQLQSETAEGFPTINLINSHDLSKKLTLAIGYYRLICSNGLIAPAGIANAVNARHNFSNNNNSALLEAISQVFDQYSLITDQINKFKSRELSDSECSDLAQYAKRIRFRFRKNLPQKVDSNLLLNPRRPSDGNKDLWTVFNVIQENITHGGNGLGKGITRFQDDIRFNTEMWQGTALALNHKKDNLKEELSKLFIKKTNNEDSNFGTN